MRLRIGNFARLSRVSIKTLRYYDEIGILKPVYIDAETNYRYYDIKQLARIHRILALKDLNLSLDHIQLMLDNDVSTEQIQSMLDLKQAELEQDIREAHSRLAEVQFRLRLLQNEKQLPHIDIKVTNIPSFVGLTEHLLLKRHDNLIMSQQMAKRGKLYQEIFSCYKIPQKPPISIMYDFNINATIWHMQSVIPIEQNLDTDTTLSDGSILAYEMIPSLPVAATYIFEGSYDQIIEQTIIVERWMLENNYERGRQTRIIYHRGPMHFEEPGDFVTEIQIEIAPN